MDYLGRTANLVSFTACVTWSKCDRAFVRVCAFFFGGGVTPVAYGSSQARGQIGAQPLAYTKVTAMPDPSCVFDLHHSSRQCRILNSLSEARD